MSKTFNNSGVGAANCICLVTPSDDSPSASVVDLVNSGNILTQDTGGSGLVTGAYGYGFALDKKDSTDEFGWNFGTPVSFPGASSAGVTAFVALNSITSPGAGASFYMFCQDNATIGGFPLIAFAAGAPYTPILKTGSTTRVTGNSIGPSTAQSIAITGSFGTSRAFTLYQNGASVGTPFTGSNIGATANVGRLGGVNGQGEMPCNLMLIALFNTVLTAQNISDLHNSLTGGGAFSLVNLPGAAATPFLPYSSTQFFVEERVLQY